VTTVALPTLDEARKRGRAVREQSPRTSLAQLAQRPDSYDPVGRLRWQGESRVQGLLALRYKRMLVDPLSFYRGSALLMAEDIARSPSTSLEVQICGDAHLSNFNLFSSPERHHVFDVNDFDETDQGPFEWDIKRLVTSLVIASHHLGHSAGQQETIAIDAARTYRLSMRRFAVATRLSVWYATLDVDAMLHDLDGFFTENVMRKFGSVVHRASSASSAKSLDKLISYGTDGPRILANPPLLIPVSDLHDESHLTYEELTDVATGYVASLNSDRRALVGQFVPVDAARKVVGVGSVGTDCYVILFVGRDQFDPFFLQIKEATESVVAIALGRTSTMAHGERVVLGQRLMQATPDVFLGWNIEAVGRPPRSFYVRQLYDNKSSIAVDRLDESLLVTYGRICAWVLARSHARSGRGAEIAGYLGKSTIADEAIAGFATAYRERTVDDYHALQRAATEGRITVTT
jgi:uncharacterized protein (DUF2252 family)